MFSNSGALRSKIERLEDDLRWAKERREDAEARFRSFEHGAQLEKRSLLNDMDLLKRAHTQKIEHMQTMQSLETAKEVNKLRDEMQEALIKSDLLRVAAETALATYEKFDTKEDRKTLLAQLDKAMEGLIKAVQTAPVVNVSTKK